jgi:superfamily II DNA or RNA helicase
MPAASATSPERLAARPLDEDWRTTDQEEVERRRLRAVEEAPAITNRDPRYPVFSNFDVHSQSGVNYSVEIRDLARRHFSCDCVDFGINGLGTCKHVEAVLTHLGESDPSSFERAATEGSPRIDLMPDRANRTLHVEHGLERLPRGLRRMFDAEGRLTGGLTPEMALEWWQRSAQPELRISQEVAPWIECRRRERESQALRRSYEQNVQAGLWPGQETLVPLFPYQRAGMLHLACTERALLADEMGLGKTIQAIAACALLRRMGRVERVLVVTPVSLRGEWEEQIGRLTRASCRVVNGSRAHRMDAYQKEGAAVFSIVTYEQMLTDALEVNARLQPQVVILDEAQRIKNWSAKTALAVKRLRSRYAWVLTGAPPEERIDELYSLVSFLDPSVFGPLFRFNREFYEFDERGRPLGYRHLDQLRERVRPLLLRRRRADVASELPSRTERTFLVPMSERQRAASRTHEAAISKLLASNRRRPLSAAQRERLISEANILRMLADTGSILDGRDRTCPKIDELGRIIPDCISNPEAKVLVFSEWERMLELVADLCRRLRISFAFQTGKQSAAERRSELQRFRDDPGCRVLLCTDAKGPAASLQGASVVIHCDQPWDVARLEQRVSRAWQPEQMRGLTVLSLVSEGTIEQRIHSLRNESGGGARPDFISRLEALWPEANAAAGDRKRRVLAGAPAQWIQDNDADRPKQFCAGAAELLDGALVACEERFPEHGENSVLLVVVNREAERWREQLRPLEEKCLRQPRAGDSAPEVKLEVIDAEAAGMLRRLAEFGVMSPSVRASRQLYPAPESNGVAPLTPPERERARQARERHARKLKMARVLLAETMIEEARGALVEAVHELGRALAIEHRQPEPVNALGAVAPPSDRLWPGAESNVPLLRAFLENDHAAIEPVLRILGQPPEAEVQRAKSLFAGLKARLAEVGNGKVRR